MKEFESVSNARFGPNILAVGDWIKFKCRRGHKYTGEVMMMHSYSTEFTVIRMQTPSGTTFHITADNIVW